MPFAVGGIKLHKIKSSGLTDYNGVVDGPFGARLGFRHGHSGSIPINGSNKPFYYRWSYKKESQTDWHDFTETVVRHYVKEDPNNPDKPPTFPTVTLGPHGIKNMHLYEFRPHQAPPCPGYNTYWPTDTWFADIYTGFLDSVGLPGGIETSAGEYKIKLEIFDDKGNRIIPGVGTFQFIVPTGIAADGVTFETRKASSNEIEDDGYVFYLNIDNRKCIATIDPPTIDGVPAGLDCGLLSYSTGDEVTINFHALHPANFATFSFWLKRAIITLYPAMNNDVAAPTAGVYAGDGNGNFDNDFPTSALLNTCSTAAFAEILRVYSKATNGWRRLHELDDHYELAFALTPKKSEGT
jgi:hypothetical protein